MPEQNQPILEIFDTYKTAVNAKDVNAFVALYDPNVVIFDMWGEWSYKGIAAWKNVVTDWFGSLGSERVIVEINDAEIIKDDHIAYVHAFVTFTGVTADGETLRAMQNRFTWVLKNQDGAWKIVHEHSSAPIDFETSKVILQQG